MVIRYALLDAPLGAITSQGKYQIATLISFVSGGSFGPGHGKRRIATL